MALAHYDGQPTIITRHVPALAGLADEDRMDEAWSDEAIDEIQREMAEAYNAEFDTRTVFGGVVLDDLIDPDDLPFD